MQFLTLGCWRLNPGFKLGFFFFFFGDDLQCFYARYKVLDISHTSD